MPPSHTPGPELSPDALRLALYARCSTSDQNPDAQLHQLKEYAAARGFEVLEFVDHGISGRKDRRVALDRLLEAARRREIDAVAVVKLDRLARSVRHLTQLAAEFQALGVDLIVLDQGIDTSTPTGRLLFNVLGSIAEFEGDLIRERTRAGVAAARRRGRRLGRPRAPVSIHEVHTLLGQGLSRAEVARKLGVSRSTLGRALGRVSEIVSSNGSASPRSTVPQIPLSDLSETVRF